MLAGPRSHMDGPLADRKRGFLDCLRAGRMGVAGPRQILGGTAEFHQNAGFVDHFAGFAADNVHAEHAISLRICENFYKAFRGLVDLGAAVRGEGEFADGIGDPRLLQFFLGLADGRHFRRGIHDAWDNVVVHVPGLAGDDFRNRHTFVLGLVRQHRAGDDVADRIDAFHGGGKMRIDLHAAAAVERNAGFLQAKAFGVGHPADADQHHVGFELLRRAAGRGFDGHRQHLARGINRGDLGAELEHKALLLQQALELPGDFAVHAGQDAVEEFDHHDLGTEPVPHRAELEPDHAGADDQQFLRHLFERQRAGRRHDALLVDLDALQPRDVRAGGDHDVPGLDRLRLAVGGHLDLAGAKNFAGAFQDVDLVLLHQEVDALDVAVDALLLEIHHRRQIELWRGDADAHLRKRMRGFLEHLGSMQERLGWHAADIEAGAAEGRIFDHRDLHAKLRRAHRADVTAGPGADDDEIVSGHE